MSHSLSLPSSFDKTIGSMLTGKSIINTSYELVNKCIAVGNFGEIHLAKDNETDEIVAIKLVSKEKDANDKLKKEYELYRKLGSTMGLPKIYHFQQCPTYNALVMELLGPNLESVFQSCNRMFSVRTTTQIALQIIEMIRYIHSQKLIVCNIKPENFCLGPSNTNKADRVYMIGIKNAKPFETADTHQHIPKTDELEDGNTKIMTGFGTPRYMSLNAHKGKRLSRRDDLESIGYMLIYFMLGRLPWQGILDSDQADRYEKIYSIKKSIHLEELCHKISPEYYHYMLYVRTLKYAQEPNYRYIIQMFTNLINKVSIETNGRLSSNIGSIDELKETSKMTMAIQSSSSLSSTPSAPTSPPSSSSSPVNTYRKQVSFT